LDVIQGKGTKEFCLVFQVIQSFLYARLKKIIVGSQIPEKLFEAIRQGERQ